MSIFSDIAEVASTMVDDVGSTLHDRANQATDLYVSPVITNIEEFMKNDLSPLLADYIIPAVLSYVAPPVAAAWQVARKRQKDQVAQSRQNEYDRQAEQLNEQLNTVAEQYQQFQTSTDPYSQILQQLNNLNVNGLSDRDISNQAKNAQRLTNTGE
jgi:hypothetical protein